MTPTQGFIRACLCLCLGSKVHVQDEVPRLLALVLHTSQRRRAMLVHMLNAASTDYTTAKAAAAAAALASMNKSRAAV